MSLLDELLFEKDFADVRQDAEAHRWTLERADTLAVDVTISSQRAPNELYMARLRWTEYPGRLPASIVFVNSVTRIAGEKSSWPKIAGVRPPNDICACWTAEGYIAHPEWLGDANMAWNTGDNALLTQLRLLQHQMDFTYQGPVND